MNFIPFYVWPLLLRRRVSTVHLRHDGNYSNGDILSSLFPYVNCVTILDSVEAAISVRFCLLTVCVAINFLLSCTACSVLFWCLLIVTDPPSLLAALPAVLFFPLHVAQLLVPCFLSSSFIHNKL